MPTIREVYDEMLKLHAVQVEEMTIRLLLMETNGLVTMSDLYIAMNRPMKHLNEFQRLFARVLNGEPVQYVLRKATFFGIPLYVDERVLIPRPETEELVEKVIRKLLHNDMKSTLTIADIGTGSGCIAFALESALPTATIFATDISPDSLDVARLNATNLNSKVTFFQGDMLAPLIEKQIHLNVLISNPPYIENPQEVERNVINYEPHAALFALAGTDYYEKMLKLSPFILREGALIFFEINYDQEERLAQLVNKYIPGSKFDFMKDLQGKTRFLSILYSQKPTKSKDS